MMRVDDLCPGQGCREQRGDRLGGVAAQARQRPQHPHLEPTRLAPAPGPVAEGDQPDVGLGRQCPGQLQRVALAPAVQAL